MTEASTSSTAAHTLRINKIELIGGRRLVDFSSGLNLIRGDITTGKTTLVRLLRGLLGGMPRHLPPETALVRALNGNVLLGSRTWNIYRPMLTTAEAPVDVADEAADPESEGFAVRLPAAGQGGYGEFVLTQLNLPVVSVPRARREPTNELSPVTINDWLLYCIVTGDELDTQVFGHRDAFRDLKRRWVFELAYGLYNEDLANLSAALRRIDIEIKAVETEAEVIRQFMAGTTIGKPEELEADLVAQQERLSQLQAQAQTLAQASTDAEPGEVISDARARVLDSRRHLDELRTAIRQHESQLRDLSDLLRQLSNVSQRLTRSIVADEWMVDFDFVVCPRCGNDVDMHRAESPICYLCEQPEPTTAPNRESLIREQDRVTSQVAETEQLIGERQTALDALRADERVQTAVLAEASARLDSLTSEFVSARAAQLQAVASETATIEANAAWTRRYLEFVGRQSEQAGRLAALQTRKAEIEEEIESNRTSVTDADANIAALEQRMLDYLTRLHVPQLGDLLTVKINPNTYLPEVSTRTFDELSSQGLKTLVNVAHALAHHTVAIDRGLRMPGLLVLDGVSANSGKEGFEGDRIVDMYELFREVSEQYGERLQLIVVDNDLPAELGDELVSHIVLTLSQESRLIGDADEVAVTDDGGGETE